jgi:hypothetical protein
MEDIFSVFALEKLHFTSSCFACFKNPASDLTGLHEQSNFAPGTIFTHPAKKPRITGFENLIILRKLLFQSTVGLCLGA